MLNLNVLNARVSIAGRMLILSVLMVIPVAIAGYLLVMTHKEVIEMADTEAAGQLYLSSAWNGVLSGASGQAMSDDQKTRLTEDAQKNSAMTGAEAARSLVATTSGDLLSGSKALIDTLADKSGLILDPDLDSFYMMDAVDVKLPQDIVAARALFDARDQAGTDAEYQMKAATFKNGIFATKASIQKSGEYTKSKALPTDVASALDAYIAAGTAFAANQNQATFDQYLSSANALFGPGSTALVSLLHKRSAGQWARMAREVGLCGLILGLAVGLSLIIGSGLTQRLRVLTDVMQKLIKGHDVGGIPFQEDKHETGVIVKTLAAFKQTLAETEQMRLMQHQAEEEGITNRRAAMLDLADEFESSLLGIVKALGDSAQRLGRSAEALTVDASVTSQRSDLVAASMEMASANVQSVAGATEEMAASSYSIADQAQRAADAADNAASKAHETTAVVADMNDAAQRIGSAIDMIAQITSQTNLLALNATIEAARAGEAGRGFSVVAAEVKALAQQTARATEEISSQVRGVQDATQHAAAAIAAIVEVVMELRDISTAISDSVSQQTQAVGEISRSTTEVATSTAEISDSIAEVSRTAGHTGARAQEALHEARSLTSQASTLRQTADTFLNNVRAA